MDLMLTSLFALIVVLTLVQFLIHKTRCGRLINKIPGPRFLPIIGNALDFAIPKEEDLWPAVKNWSDKYYSTFKVWLGNVPIVMVRHPVDVEVVLSSQKNITKSFFYDLLKPWLNEGLLMSSGNKWRARRKMLTPAFHYNVLQDFVGVFVETAELMVRCLTDEGGEVVKDVNPFFGKYMLKAICETAMGTTLQTDDPKQDKYREAIKFVGETAFHRARKPWFLCDWIFSLTQKGREQVKALRILHSFTTEIIEKRRLYHEATGGNYLKIFSSDNETRQSLPNYDVPLKKKRLAMLDLLIAVQKEHGAIDDAGIREEVDTFIFEGHDTTNTALCFAVLLLAEHEEIQARARAEVGSILKESNGKLTVNELQNMTYLDCCIKESLRMFPAVPIFSRNLTADLPIRKFVLPIGTNVAVNAFQTHRDPHFWPQPKVFDPDRFLPERISGRHPYSYIPFSAGPRNCIGQRFAMLELKSFLALLLQDFYLEPMVETSGVRLLPDLVLKSVYPLRVKFVPVR